MSFNRLADTLDINYQQSDELNNSILNLIKFLHNTNQLESKTIESIYTIWINYIDIPQWFNKNNIVYIAKTCNLIEDYKNNIDKYPNTNIIPKFINLNTKNDMIEFLNKILLTKGKYASNPKKYNKEQLSFLLNKYFYPNNNKEIVQEETIIL